MTNQQKDIVIDHCISFIRTFLSIFAIDAAFMVSRLSEDGITEASMKSLLAALLSSIIKTIIQLNTIPNSK